MLKPYFQNLYRHTMDRAYASALAEITTAMSAGGACLDCGAGQGYWYEQLVRKGAIHQDQYHGIEWNAPQVELARARGIDIRQGDLNKSLPCSDGEYTCIFALSVLEHLLYGCAFLRECHRSLHTGGTLVLLTPNISTYFTAFLILAGKMPSSGPHPDSRELLGSESILSQDRQTPVPDVESDTPLHRHLVVFSYRTLKKYLSMIGFRKVRGYGYGLYPLPVLLQGPAEKLDPWHCHQMVFIAVK